MLKVDFPITEDMIKYTINYIVEVKDKLHIFGSSINLEELEKIQYKLGDNKFIIESNDNLIDYQKENIRLMEQVEYLIKIKKNEKILE
jgi:hypothetical protein